MRGSSLENTTANRHRAQQPHPHLYREFASPTGQQALRQAPAKPVRTNLRKNKSAPSELYNLDTNPAESTDQSKTHPDIVKDLETTMKSARTPTDQKLWEIFD